MSPEQRFELGRYASPNAWIQAALARAHEDVVKASIAVRSRR
jgi:hypothetical protein